MKTAKLFLSLAVFAVLGIFLAAAQAAPRAAKSKAKQTKGEAKMEQTEKSGIKTLVVYFSATGNTKKVSETLAKAADADIYEIKPLKPYTDADLDWTDRNSRSSVEMRDKKSRPEIAADKFSVKQYDTVYVGFPIWWGTAPTVVNTFLEKHDFSDKTIIVFATSGGSPLGNSAKDIKKSVAETAKVISGRILSPGATESELKKWIESVR